MTSNEDNVHHWQMQKRHSICCLKTIVKQKKRTGPPVTDNAFSDVRFGERNTPISFVPVSLVVDYFFFKAKEKKGKKIL